jgi:hypothetical protein
MDVNTGAPKGKDTYARSLSGSSGQSRAQSVHCTDFSGTVLSLEQREYSDCSLPQAPKLAVAAWHPRTTNQLPDQIDHAIAVP